VNAMSENASYVSPEDIEGMLTELKEEADEIGGPSILSRRILAAGSAILTLLLVYLAGKRSGERTKTLIEVIRSE
tara:strand:- start:326 stop:550 length:225 start_codon:yes stop_codon:yes gene_type:complete